MAPTELLVRGLRWSYRRYGPAGAAAFAVLAVLGYYLVRRWTDGSFGGEDGPPADDGPVATDPDEGGI